MFSKRYIAKVVAQTTVGVAADTALETTIEKTTDIDTDTITCTVGTAVFGWIVSEKLKPVTDAAVDKVADRWQSRKDRKNTPES